MPGRGDEVRVVAAFERNLEADGWRIIKAQGNYADVIAIRGDERLIAEAKGALRGR
jgi:hypothetical protein